MPVGISISQSAGLLFGALAAYLDAPQFEGAALHRVFLLAAAAGAMGSPYLGDTLGRRSALASLALLSTPLCCYCMFVDGRDFHGYCVLGLCAGGMLAIAPVYAAECTLSNLCIHSPLSPLPSSLHIGADASTRGRRVAHLVLAVSIGTVYARTLKLYALTATTERVAAMGPVALVQLLVATSLCFSPESPHWILANKTPYECIEALQRLRYTDDVADEFKGIYLALSDDAK